MAPKTVGLFCVSLCLVLLGREGSAYEKCSVADASGTVVDVNICDGVLVCCKEDKSSCCNSTITVNTPVNILHKSLDYSEPKDKGSRDSQAAVVPLREMNAAVNVGQDNVVRDIRTTSVSEMRIAGHRDSAWYRRIITGEAPATHALWSKLISASSNETSSETPDESRAQLPPIH